MGSYNKKHVKKGDLVKVLSGSDKGKRGVIKKMFIKTNRALVDGVNIVTKHVRPSSQNPEKGGLVLVEAAVHLSNLMLVEPSSGNPTRSYRKLGLAGRLVRFSKKTDKSI